MDIRQLQEVSLELLDPEVLDTELGAMVVHTCPECGNALSKVECSASCPYFSDCEDREVHKSGEIFWCPLYQIVERKWAEHQEVGLAEVEA